MMAVLIDKMLRTQIVTCAAVANWIFIPAMKVQHVRLLMVFKFH